MNVQILTPERKFFAGEAESVSFPGTDGRFEILNNHAPLISSLKEGDIRIRTNGKDTLVKIKGGFVEVLQNNINVMVEGAE